MKKFVYIETYGCSSNKNNAEIMAGILKSSGIDVTNNLEIADILIVNTCIVKSPTENKIKRRIEELKKFKKPLIISGCMPEILKIREKNIFLLGTHHVKDIANLIKSIYENNYDEKRFLDYKNEEKICLPKISSSAGITQISEGCLGECSYCITKIAKGKLFSYSKDRIIKNVVNDLNNCKEIWITSQDNASYGLDKGKREIVDLLKEILAINKKFYLKLGMMNPNNILPILDDIIEIYKNEKMFKFLHIPLQSGSNKILKLMNRKYTREGFLEIIDKFRKEIPEITLATDVIVAYPQETEEDFNETLDLIRKIQADIVNISKYWPMKGTIAEKEKQVDFSIAKKRAEILSTISKKIIQDKNKKYLGWQGKCLITGKKSREKRIARSLSYKLIKIPENKSLVGKVVNVKIIGLDKNNFTGEVV